MTIGIDISMLMYQGSGVATYTYNLVKNLLRIDKKNTYHLFYSSFRKPIHFGFIEEFRKLGAKVFVLPFPPKILQLLWGNLNIMPVEWFIGKVDIFHFSDFSRPPLLSGTKGITTVHDLTWKIYPEFHTPEVIAAHRKKIRKTLQYNDTIIADSQKTKDDLLHFFPSMKNSITIVSLGVDDRFFIKHIEKDIDAVLKKYNILKPYILYVGAIEPRKNLVNLIKAFSDVAKQYPDYYLCFVGRAGWNKDEVFHTISALNLQNRIYFAGYAEDADLPFLYQGASVFVYPSLYEGFGLPPLESIASGAPTIAYNSPSIPGSFKKTVSADDIKNGILQNLKHPTIPTVEILRWKEVAEKVLKLYEDIMKPSYIPSSSKKV